MNNCQVFLEFFDKMVDEYEGPIPQEVWDFYHILQEQKDKYVEKPLLTETGLQILEYLQTHGSTTFKAKDIADGLDVSSRKINGAMRKLASDGYVDKNGTNPVIYSLSNKGKSFDLERYKGDINHEESN